MLASRKNTAATDSPELERAISCLRRGGVVVYPTETFYGLGADAWNEAALHTMFQLKGRPGGKPISVLISGTEMLASVAREISPRACSLIERFWPGPLTLVLPAAPALSELLTAGSGTVGVRWSSHPIADRLVQRLGAPLTTPSANPAGAPPPTTLEQARAYFGDAVGAYVDGGPLAGELASTVVQVDPLRVLREGAVPSTAIERALKEAVPHG